MRSNAIILLCLYVLFSSTNLRSNFLPFSPKTMVAGRHVRANQDRERRIGFVFNGNGSLFIKRMNRIYLYAQQYWLKVPGNLSVNTNTQDLHCVVVRRRFFASPSGRELKIIKEKICGTVACKFRATKPDDKCHRCTWLRF